MFLVAGFIDFVVKPLFEEFEKFLPCDMLSEQLHNMTTNRMTWGDIAKEQAAQIRQLSLDVDINSNVETVDCGGFTSADSGTESDGISSPVSSVSGASHSDLDDLPSDISDIHSHVTQVGERMEWCDSVNSERRKSLPISEEPSHTRDRYGRRESFPRIHDNRRACLPHTSLYQAISFDRLVEKLTNIERPSIKSIQPAYNTPLKQVDTVNLDNLLAEPRLSTLCPSIETSKITNYLLTKRKFYV